MGASRATLKTFFETADFPTQAQFSSLIDSLVSTEDSNLINGETTFDADVIFENGKVQKAKNGGGQLNLRLTKNSNVSLTTDNDAFEEGWFFADTKSGSIGFGNVAANTISSFFCTDKKIILLLNGPGATSIAAFEATNNAAGNDMKIGFFNTPEKSQPIITGSRGGNVALTNLLFGLNQLGLIVDNTTA